MSAFDEYKGKAEDLKDQAGEHKEKAEDLKGKAEGYKGQAEEKLGGLTGGDRGRDGDREGG